LPVATFSYTGTPYCQNASNPSPTFSGGGVAGTFSSTAGLNIDAITGTVNLSASTPGTYTVTNTIASSGGCPAVIATSPITITPLPVATFSYTASPYCQNAANPFPAFSGGGVAGTFSSSAGLVFVSTSTGEINLSTSTAGTYTVTNTIVSSGGCPAVTATASVTITSLPVATFSYTGSPYCQGAANPSPTFSGGGVAGTFTSTAGLNVDALTGVVNLAASTTGTYTVTNTIAASGGCPAVTATATITISFLPVATFSYTGSPYCQGSANPSPTFSGGGVAGTFSSSAGLIFVNTSTGEINLSTSTPGTYVVTNSIPASAGCSGVSATASVTINPLPVATFSYTGTPYCQNAVNPTPTFSGGGVAGTFTSGAGLVINSSTGEVDLAASTVGTYTVTNTIPAGSGCPAVTATSPITITPLPVATFSYTGTPYCQNASNPTPVFSGGGVAGTFSSTAGLVFVSSSTGEINLAGSTAGNYTVTNTIAASGGCPAVTATFAITITPLPIGTFSYTGTPYCQNAANPSPVFSGGGVAGVFSSSTGLSINSGTGLVDLAASTPDTYTVSNTIAAANGCPAVTDSATITINALDNAGFLYSSSTFCQSGTNPNAIVVGLTGGTFSSSPAGLTIDATTGTITLASSTLNTYTVTYSTNGPCPNSSTFNVTITNAPSATFSYSGPYCQGGSPNPLPSFGAGASAGTFSSAGLFINASTGEIDLSASTAGTYTVTNDIAASGGCAASSATATVTIDPAAVASAGLDDAICASGIYTLAGSVSGGASTLTWSSPTGGIFSNATSGNSTYTPSAADISNGSVVLTITTNDPAGACSAVTDQMTLTIDPVATANAGADGSVCSSGIYTLGGSTGGSATALTWSSPTGGLFSDATSGTSTYTPSAADIANGSVVLTITSDDPANTCAAATDSMILTITPLDDASFSYASGTFCQSGTDPLPTITGSTGGTFTADPGLVINSSTGLITLASSTIGTYTVTYTTAGTCPASGTVSVTITNVQSATFNYAGPYCQTGGTNPLPNFPSGSSGGVFTSATGLSINASSGQIDLLLSTPGSYTITNSIAASGGCAAASATTSVTIDTPATANAGADTSICAGTSFTTSGTIGGSATSFTWSSAGTGTFVSNTYTPSSADSTAGSVVLTITTDDPAGACSAVMDDMILFINASPLADAGTMQTLNCGSSTVVLNGSTTTAGASFLWSGPGIVSGDSTTSPVVNSVGVYTLTVTSSSGCVGTDTVSVISNTNAPNADAGLDQALNCTTTTVTLSGSSTTAGVNYSWSGSGIVSGSGTASPVVNAAGTYTMTVTDPVNGCSSTDTVVVTNNSTVPDINAGSGQTINCAITSVNLSGSSVTSGATFNWAGPGIVSGGTTATPTVNAAGTYTLTVTDPSNGCSVTATTIVNANTTPPVANAGSDQAIGCGTPTAILNGSGSSAGAGINYSWTTTGGNIIAGSNSVSPTVDQAGTYTITVTDSNNGCSASASVNVTGTPSPIASFTANPVTGAPPLNVTFTNTSQYANTYVWIFGDGSGSVTTDASNLYSNPGTYTAMLIASDNLQCPDTTETTIVVFDYFTMLIPNVFTPNGDNSNDIFTITSTGVESMNVQIYDRWGLKLAEWDNIAGGWDGRTSSGSIASDGTYYYLITAKGQDGEEHFYKGFLTLLR
jgi:gliding motility-associated-like protein